MDNILKIALIQPDIVWEDKDANILKLRHLLAQIDKNTDLVLFPEMFLTGFSMRSAALAEETNGLSGSFLQEIARKNGYYAGGGWIEKNQAGLPFNAFSVYSPTGDIVTYRKNYPFSHAGEEKHYQRGDLCAILEIKGLRIMLSVCYDLRFPEFFRQNAGNVDAILVIANWPAVRINHWLALLRARAIENQCYVAGVNRVGTDGNGLVYNGFSSVFDPWGEGRMLGTEGEGVLHAEWSLQRVREIREKFPFLKDRFVT